VRVDLDLDPLVDDLATRIAAEVAERIASPPATFREWWSRCAFLRSAAAEALPP